MSQQIPTDTQRQKLPHYECMVCEARENLMPVPIPMGNGERAWWVCRDGYGCALDNDGGAGML